MRRLAQILFVAGLPFFTMPKLSLVGHLLALSAIVLSGLSWHATSLRTKKSDSVVGLLGAGLVFVFTKSVPVSFYFLLFGTAPMLLSYVRSDRNHWGSS